MKERVDALERKIRQRSREIVSDPRATDDQVMCAAYARALEACKAAAAGR